MELYSLPGLRSSKRQLEKRYHLKNWVEQISTPKESGVADHYAENEVEALGMVREIVSHLNVDPKQRLDFRTASPPAHDPEDLLGIIPEDNRTPFDVREVIARILDSSDFHEFKPRYGTTLVCGFGHLHGYPVGVIANNGILFSESSLKGAHFVELCGQRGTPLIFLQNISGFMVGRDAEAGGIAKDGAKLVTAVSCVPVPKFTVIIGGSHGAGNYGMCGRAYDPRFLFMWPNSRISVMGGPQAADVLTTVKQDQRHRNGSNPWIKKKNPLGVQSYRSTRKRKPLLLNSTTVG